MDLRLNGKTALVTGGSSGIGRGIAHVLAREGCNIILAARDVQRLGAVRDEIEAMADVAVKTLPVDLRNSDHIQAIAAETKTLDVLVNCASAIPPGSLFEVDDRKWRDGWDVKVFGYMTLTRAVYPLLRQSRGVVVNVIGGQGNDPRFLASATGGAALSAFTHTFAQQALSDGVRIVGVHPGHVAGERSAQFLRARAQQELGDAQRWRQFHSSLPFGRPASVEEIASAVAFLASPLSGYTTGTSLIVDGGRRS